MTVEVFKIRVHHNRLFAVLGLLLLIGAATSPKVHAAPITAGNPSTSYSITMTPSSTQLHAAPGKTTNSSFTVVNEGNNGYTMDLSVAPYHVSGINYDPEFTNLPGKTDASKWIQLSGPSSLTLPAHQPQTIDYNLDVPAGTAPGGYYAVIFAETEPPISSGVTSHNRVGDVLYITVDGKVTQGGAVKAASLPRVSFGSSLPVGVLVQNTGGVHFLSTVNLQVKSIFGKTAFQASLQRYVLPGTQRLVSSSWNKTPLVGIYTVHRGATVAGHYEALPSERIVIVKPIFLVALVVVIVLITAALSRTAGGRRRHTRKSKAA